MARYKSRSASRVEEPEPDVDSHARSSDPLLQSGVVSRLLRSHDSRSLHSSMRDDAFRHGQQMLGNRAVQRTVVPVRAKLAVSVPGDTFENEAERVAAQVMSGSAGVRSGSSALRTNGDSLSGLAEYSDHPEDLGPGHALDTDTLEFMEGRFGRAFGDVRVHTDEQSEDAASAVRARAYTVGCDIVFGEGQYSPATTDGRHLIAHELTHVVQQSPEAAVPTADAGRGGATAAMVTARAPMNIARQPTSNPVLTPEEMFEIIVRQRAWTFNPGGAPLVDPSPVPVGRGVGPAAGGKRAGFSVFAVIQVTDSHGRPVALSYGEHIQYGTPHAEQGAVAALDRTISPRS